MMNPGADAFDSIGEKCNPGWWYPNSFDKCKEHLLYKIEKTNNKKKYLISNGSDDITNEQNETEKNSGQFLNFNSVLSGIMQHLLQNTGTYWK